MDVIELPNGLKAIQTGTPEQNQKQADMLGKRHQFNLKYMKEKGWGNDLTQLSIEQIMEIRAQAGWINPV